MPENGTAPVTTATIEKPAPARRIRVLHLIPGLGHGGGEHQLLLNVTNLDPDLFENFICHTAPRTHLVPEFEKLGVKVFSAVTSGIGSWPRQIRKIRKLVKELDIDIIHTTNSQAWMTGGIVGRITKTQVLATLNSNAYEETRLIDNPHLNKRKLFYAKKKSELALRMCTTRHIAISNYVKSSQVARMGLKPDTVDVVYRGVTKDYFEEPEGDLDALREELGIKDAFPVILNVARLVPPKGQRYAIEAMPEIIKHQPKARLVLIGIGNREKSLRELADQLGVSDHVLFAGIRTDVRNVHAVSDIFVFPSVYEGFGSALGEAMAAGDCCITTGEPPMTEIVEHEVSGLHVPSQDSAAIAEAVIRVSADDELRARFQAAGRERARNLFRIEQVVSQLEQVYLKMIPDRFPDRIKA